MRETNDNAAPPSVNARIPVGFGDLYLSDGDHVAHFYRSDEEWLDLAAGFFDAGLKSGDKCVFVVTPGAREEQFKQRLSDRGVSVEAALASGQLVIFEGKDKLSDMQEELARSLAEIPDGFPLLRWAGDMSWSRACRSAQTYGSVVRLRRPTRPRLRRPPEPHCQHLIRHITGDAATPSSVNEARVG